MQNEPLDAPISIENSTTKLAFALVTLLFFLWGIAINLNPILIPHLKKACQLTNFQSAFIDSSMFLAYFLAAIPAGRFMGRFGYQSGIVAGLFLFASGAFLMWPAAAAVSYPFFLGALFILASGLTFLETAANPYVTVLGDAASATQRLNFAQSFNGLAATLAPFLGGLFILTGSQFSTEQIAALSEAERLQHFQHEAATVQMPFFIIGCVVATVGLIFWKIKLPDIRSKTTVVAAQNPLNLLKNKQLRSAVVAQFFYVGGQVCISSFFIRFAFQTAGLAEKSAAQILSLALLLFMIGRFVGTFLMQYVRPARLLIYYSLACVVLLISAISTQGMVSVYSLVGVEFFMSILFPTIFSMGVRGLGEDTKLGSSLLIMSIVGGAILPLAMGKLSDAFSVQTAYIVPMLCFSVVAWFGFRHVQTAEIH